MEKEKILIGIPCGINARFNDFSDCVDALDKPLNTSILRLKHPSVAKNRNDLVQIAIQYKFTHILFLDDDMTFKPNLLKQLLAHDRDIVSGLCTYSTIPFQPVIFDGIGGDGRCICRFIKDEAGLLPVWGSTLACTLVHMRVFDKLEPPYFKLGQMRADEFGEDVDFLIRVNQAGIKCYVDLDAHVGHHTQLVVRPVLHEEKLRLALTDKNGYSLFLEMAEANGNS